MNNWKIDHQMYGQSEFSGIIQSSINKPKGFKMTVQKYQKTIDTTVFSTEDYKKLKVGQWVKILDNKGQYLGVTFANVVTINYNKAPNMVRQFKSNHELRIFAKLQGSN